LHAIVDKYEYFPKNVKKSLLFSMGYAFMTLSPILLSTNAMIFEN